MKIPIVSNQSSSLRGVKCTDLNRCMSSLDQTMKGTYSLYTHYHPDIIIEHVSHVWLRSPIHTRCYGGWVGVVTDRQANLLGLTHQRCQNRTVSTHANLGNYDRFATGRLVGPKSKGSSGSVVVLCRRSSLDTVGRLRGKAYVFRVLNRQDLNWRRS